MYVRVRYEWDERIRRAESLRENLEFARTYLNFYILLAGHQKQLYEELASVIRPHALTWGKGGLPLHSGFLEEHRSILLSYYADYLTFVRDCGTDILADQATHLLNGRGQDAWFAILKAYWTKEWSFFEAEPSLYFFGKGFLQPYAELLAEYYYQPLDAGGLEWTVSSGGNARCPLCDHRPQLSVLRTEGEGAKRMLLCSLCGTEWRYKRVSCPYCGEEHNEKLAYHRSETFPHVRIDVCESCRHYLKAVDLTQDGRAVPVVDDIATLPLDLWAMEQGYQKEEINLVGV